MYFLVECRFNCTLTPDKSPPARVGNFFYAQLLIDDMILQCAILLVGIGGTREWSREKNQITQMSYKSKQLKISIFGTHFVAHSYKSPADVIKTATKEQSSIEEREREKKVVWWINKDRETQSKIPIQMKYDSRNVEYTVYERFFHMIEWNKIKTFKKCP